MLADGVGDDVAGVFFGHAAVEGELEAAGGVDADDAVDETVVVGVVVGLALPISVGADGAEVEDFVGIAGAVDDVDDALAGVAAGLNVKADADPVGAGLLHH